MSQAELIKSARALHNALMRLATCEHFATDAVEIIHQSANNASALQEKGDLAGSAVFLDTVTYVCFLVHAVAEFQAFAQRVARLQGKVGVSLDELIYELVPETKQFFQERQVNK